MLRFIIQGLVSHAHGSANDDDDEISRGPHIQGRHQISKAPSTRCIHQFQDQLTKTRSAESKTQITKDDSPMFDKTLKSLPVVDLINFRD